MVENTETLYIPASSACFSAIQIKIRKSGILFQLADEREVFKTLLLMVFMQTWSFTVQIERSKVPAMQVNVRN